jgi:hypothetical protein
VRPQEGARPGVTARGLGHGRPVGPRDQHRVARFPLVGGDRDGGPFRVRGDQPADRQRADERLVRQRDHHGADVTRRQRFGGIRRPQPGGGQEPGVSGGRHQDPQPAGERGSHPRGPVRVVHGGRPRYLKRRGPGDDKHRVGSAVP